jgi:hypothetical protein
MHMGIAEENIKFPAVLTCPCCGKSALYCYDDTAREDIWLACEACSAHGNIITFAAQIWKLDIAQTLTRFDENGLCARKNNVDEVTQLIKQGTRLAAAEKFWKAAKAQLWSHDDPGIEQKLREFGVSKDLDCEGLVGVATPAQLDELCPAVARAYPSNFAKTPSLVFPYYDLPQRFSGFLLMQYGEDVAANRAFIAISRSGRFKPEAGYYLMHTALLPLSTALNQSFFAVDDPVWALKAQTIQLRHGLGLLPVCASYAGKEAISYGATLTMFPHSRRFFSGRVVTPSLVSQAAVSRGYVCTPPEKRSPHPDIPLKTVARLADIYKAAITWQTALSNVFESMNPLAAQAFTEELNITRDRLQRFFQERTVLPKDTVNKILERVVPHHGVDHDRYRAKDVIDKENGWYTTSGEPISNCAPVITRIIFTDTGDKYYEGYVKKDASTYEFFEKASVIEIRGLFIYVSQLLAEHGQLAIYSVKNWNVRALGVALSLHPPQVVHIANTPGWSEKTREFQFRNYSIRNDGTIVPIECPAICKENPVDFPDPTSAAPETIHSLLTPSHENATIWAMTAIALAGITAPMLNVSPRSFALGSDVFTALSALGPHLGCGFELIGRHGRHNTAGLTQMLTHVNWPTFVTLLNDGDSMMTAGIIKGAYSPAFLKMAPSSITAALSFNWCALKPIKLPNPETDTSALSFVVPSYIQHILRNRLAVRSGGILVNSILPDLHKWLEHTYNASFNLAAASRIIVGPENVHVAFMQEVCAGITAGELDILPRPRLPRQPKNYIIRNKKHWWLNKKAINAYITGKGCVVPDWNVLLNCFVKQGVFAGESTINKLTGILVTREWCDAFRESSAVQEIKDVG